MFWARNHKVACSILKEPQVSIVDPDMFKLPWYWRFKCLGAQGIKVKCSRDMVRPPLVVSSIIEAFAWRKVCTWFCNRKSSKLKICPGLKPACADLGNIRTKSYHWISATYWMRVITGRVATDLENLENSENFKETFEWQGICLWSQGICDRIPNVREFVAWNSFSAKLKILILKIFWGSMPQIVSDLR